MLLLADEIHRAIQQCQKLENRLRTMHGTYRNDLDKVRAERRSDVESDVEQAISTLEAVLNDVDDRVVSSRPAREYGQWLGEATIALAYRTVITDLREYQAGGG